MLGSMLCSQVTALVTQARVHVHPARVEPDKKRLFGVLRALDEIQTTFNHLLIEGLHTFTTELTRILDSLFSDLTETRINRIVFFLGCLGVEYSTRAKLLEIRRILRQGDSCRIALWRIRVASTPRRGYATLA